VTAVQRLSSTQVRFTFSSNRIGFPNDWSSLTIDTTTGPEQLDGFGSSTANSVVVLFVQDPLVGGNWSYNNLPDGMDFDPPLRAADSGLIA